MKIKDIRTVRINVPPHETKRTQPRRDAWNVHADTAVRVGCRLRQGHYQRWHLGIDETSTVFLQMTVPDPVFTLKENG